VDDRITDSGRDAAPVRRHRNPSATVRIIGASIR
jgi:hypothetical protein